MADYRSRNMAPLSDEQWQAIDKTVTEVARNDLVGRRFIQVYGPLGPGVQTAISDVFTGITAGNVDMLGENEQADVARVERRNFIPLPLLYKDFRLHWRDIETSQQFGVPFDTSPAAAAADYCAHAEDNLIFNGNPALGYEGLLYAAGRITITMSDWGQLGRAFSDIVAATEALITAGFFGPYALVVSPLMYASMHRVYENTGVLEIDQVRKIATAGVFRSPVLPEPSAIVVETGPQNLDLVLAQDFTTAFLQTENMNHYFRVFESLALRIKRPQAICVLEKGTRAPRGRRPRSREEETPAQEA
ncbi:MAG: bacteriocin family protein [Chloroflexi bacterium]|nr:bacteriocin family protein [Chloroflexota bacterium]